MKYTTKNWTGFVPAHTKLAERVFNAKSRRWTRMPGEYRNSNSARTMCWYVRKGDAMAGRKAGLRAFKSYPEGTFDAEYRPRETQYGTTVYDVYFRRAAS